MVAITSTEALNIIDGNLTTRQNFKFYVIFKYEFKVKITKQIHCVKNSKLLSYLIYNQRK